MQCCNPTPFRSRRSAGSCQQTRSVYAAWCCVVAGSRAGVVPMLGCVSASSGGAQKKVAGMCGALKVCLYISNLITVMM